MKQPWFRRVLFASAGPLSLFGIRSVIQILDLNSEMFGWVLLLPVIAACFVVGLLYLSSAWLDVCRNRGPIVDAVAFSLITVMYVWCLWPFASFALRQR